MPVLQNLRAWAGLGLAVAIVLVVVSWFGLISPLRADTTLLRGQQTAVEQQNVVLSHKLDVLRSQKENMASLRASLRSADQALPSDSGLPDFTRQVSRQAAGAGVVLGSIAVGAVTPVGRAAAAAAPAAPAAKTPTATAAAGSATAGQLFAIPVTITTRGSAKAQFAFVKALEQVGPRRALITSAQFGPDAAATVASIDGGSTLTTVLTVFSAPLTPEALAARDKLIAGSGAK